MFITQHSQGIPVNRDPTKTGKPGQRTKSEKFSIVRNWNTSKAIVISEAAIKHCSAENCSKYFRNHPLLVKLKANCAE